MVDELRRQLTRKLEAFVASHTDAAGEAAPPE
jgi:hypothetical protein